MQTFTFKVTVEVEDDLGMSTECYDEDYSEWCDTDYDEEGNVTAMWLSPQAKASIILNSRLGVEEDLGRAIGNYDVSWEVA